MDSKFDFASLLVHLLFTAPVPMTILWMPRRKREHKCKAIEFGEGGGSRWGEQGKVEKTVTYNTHRLTFSGIYLETPTSSEAEVWIAGNFVIPYK